MKSIALSPSGWALVSDEDFDRLSRHSWKAIESKPGYVYACRNDGGRRVRMHREVCAPEIGQVIDHINGDTLDNRRENLRAVTHTENIHNVTKPTRSGSGHRNIYQHKNGYIVRAYRFGRKLYGGWHSTLEAAIAARDSLMEER